MPKPTKICTRASSFATPPNESGREGHKVSNLLQSIPRSQPEGLPQNSHRRLATMIAAPASGQGKTVLTAAMARRFVNQGKTVRVFKIGPDYLDPTILELASRQRVYNLDLWMMGESHCRDLLARAAAANDIILVESLMGLHDNNPDNMQLARRFGLPVTLVMNVAKYAQTAAAIVEGLKNYRTEQAQGQTEENQEENQEGNQEENQNQAKITAVIGNCVGSDNHDRLLRESVGEDYAGSIRRDERMELPHRHLGLVQAADIEGLDRQLDHAARALDEFGIDVPLRQVGFRAVRQIQPPALLAGRTIAVACDAGFSFIYPENISLLESLGACIVYFSPLNDEPLPRCDAVWLPGGYPELHLQKLSGAQRVKSRLHEHHRIGKPILAECGGMMAACHAITGKDGETGAGFGLFDSTCTLRGKFQSVGLQKIDYGYGEIRGHSFHHSTLEPIDPDRVADGFGQKQDGGQGEAFWQSGKLTLTWLHHYFPSNPQAIAALFS